MSLFKRIFKPLSIDVDYLVYSSHKSATQSLIHTINNNGFKCRGWHTLAHIGRQGEFQAYLNRYHKKNGCNGLMK
jgi:hypothetical protein